MPPVLISLAISVAISIAITVLKTLLTPPPQQRPSQRQQTETPTAADGKYNFKQNVPWPAIVYGREKKGGDYFFLEEREGVAYHGTVWAAHRIQGFVQHYLHEEAVTVVGGLVTAPDHFSYGGTPYVGIATRLGLDVETAFAPLVGTFSDIWTADHRGDGLAQILMNCVSINEENFFNMYPQGMPLLTSVGDGKLLFDPREESHDPDDPSTWEFSSNLALIRLDYLTQPWGLKLRIADLHLPDWIEAADVCDEDVTNRTAGTEPRYHGALWLRWNDDPVEIGRTIDQAAELVLYENAAGKIGVHAGKMVTPDVRITTADIMEFTYDANRRAATTVLATRGRWTDPANGYNTVDAAIYGDPYTGDDTQRTKTVDNRAVRYHNHMQRLQKLAFTRANAPRVKVTIGYDAESTTRHVRRRRFVRLHHPARGLDEAIVEITGRPRLNLGAADLTITFEGIVVPATLYSFNAATEEGVPGGAVDSIVPGGVPEPENFAVAIGAEVVAGGQVAAFALASWDYLSDALTYEMEYQLADESEVPRIATSRPGEVELRTGTLRADAEYRFRLRAVSNQATSDWTGYETETATADVTPPGQPTNFNTSAAGSDVTLTWDNPNSPNLYKVDIFRGGTSSFGAAVLIGTLYGGIGEGRTYTDFSLASGTYYWWVRSSNASPGGFSTEVGPQSETI